VIPVPGGVRVSAAAVSVASLSVGCFLFTAAVVYAPQTAEGTFLRASVALAGVALALLPIAILMPPTYPGEPRIFGVRAWLVRRASSAAKQVVEAPRVGTVVAARPSTPSTT
jgi:hypothetical protein